MKISPIKGVMIFGKKGKLSRRYVGIYERLESVSKVAYLLTLPSELTLVHLVFHVSMFMKCIDDPESIFPIEV